MILDCRFLIYFDERIQNMKPVAHIQPFATGGKPPVTGYIHHSQILQRSVFGVQCSVFSRTHHSDPEPNWYIYHSDHLGSSAFLTDASGDPTQHLQYMPYGENFIEQRSITSYYTPYTFSAKERDTETGYSYFGARYYDADISIWLSVDPMAHQYPYQSGYCYVGLRPIMVIDPNGMWEQDADGNWVAKKGDNAWSLHKHAGISFNEAKKLMKDQGFKFSKDDKHVHVDVGDVVKIPGSPKEESANTSQSTGNHNSSQSGNNQTTANNPNSAQNSGNNLNAALAAAGAAALIDGPLPVGEIVGLGIIGFALYTYWFNNPSLPGPYYTERGQPWNPEPRVINNRNRFPDNNPNVNKLVKYSVYTAGAAELGRRLYDGTQPKFTPNSFNTSQTVAQPDALRVVRHPLMLPSPAP
jgi:RHS repeat-associated protein